MQMACAQYDEINVLFVLWIFPPFWSMVVTSRHRRHRVRFAIRLIIETYNKFIILVPPSHYHLSLYGMCSCKKIECFCT
jgi:hypothetical protein